MSLSIFIIIGILVTAVLFSTMAGPLKQMFSIVTDLEADARMKAIDFDFNKDVLGSPVPVLVDFWAPWCNPCRIISPVIEGISAKAGAKANVVKVNVDDNQAIARQYGIEKLPTILVFNKGRITDTLVGARDEQDYLNALGIN